MEKILVDSDVIIDFLRGHKLRIKTFFEQVEKGKTKAFISWINVVELYTGAETKKDEGVIEELLNLFKVVRLDEKSSKLAGLLRKKEGLGIADAIIASLTLVNKLKLFTFNKKDFEKIKELTFYEPN